MFGFGRTTRIYDHRLRLLGHPHSFCALCAGPSNTHPTHKTAHCPPVLSGLPRGAPACLVGSVVAAWPISATFFSSLHGIVFDLSFSLGFFLPIPTLSACPPSPGDACNLSLTVFGMLLLLFLFVLHDTIISCFESSRASARRDLPGDLFHVYIGVLGKAGGGDQPGELWAWRASGREGGQGVHEPDEGLSEGEGGFGAKLSAPCVLMRTEPRMHGSGTA